MAIGFTEALRDRVSHPIAGTFSIFYLLWNWPIFVYLTTGDSSSKERVALIEDYLKDTPCFGLFLPLISTVLYLLILPIVSKWVEEYRALIEIRKANSIQEMRLKNDRTETFRYELVRTIASRASFLISSNISGNSAIVHSPQRILRMLSPIVNDSPETPLAEGFKKLASDGDL